MCFDRWTGKRGRREREDSINVTRGCEGDGDGQVFANGLELVLEYLCVFEGKIKN